MSGAAQVQGEMTFAEHPASADPHPRQRVGRRGGVPVAMAPGRRQRREIAGYLDRPRELGRCPADVRRLRGEALGPRGIEDRGETGHVVLRSPADTLESRLPAEPIRSPRCTTKFR